MIRSFVKKISAGSIVLAFFCLAPAWLVAQTSDDKNDADQSWKASSDSELPDAAQSVRTSESHKKAGNRTLDKRTTEGVGPDGSPQMVKDVETETVKVNATTTRIIRRTYGRSLNGERTLTQVQEEEQRELPNGATKSMLTTSQVDFNGRLQVQEREERETRNVNAGTKESRLVISLPDANGGLSPATRKVERETKTGQDTSKFQKSVESRDLNGGWQITESSEGTIRENGSQKTIDETVSKADINGRLAVDSHKVTKEVSDDQGTRSTVETYSRETLGSAPDNGLHLNQRVTTVVKSKANGSTRETQVEDRNVANPSDGVRVSSKTIDIVQAGPNGTSQTRTVQADTGNGSLGVVEVDTRKSDQKPVKVDIAPTDKPK